MPIVVRVRRADVQAALAAWAPGGDIARLPVLEECARNVSYLTTELAFSEVTYRYAMAEALYLARYRTAAPVSYDAVPLARPAEVRAPTREMPAAVAAYNDAVAERYRLIIGDCVVRTGPAAAHALLTSAVATNAETNAMAAIQPIVAQCLPRGQTARFNRSSVRGILAISALRLNEAAGAPTPASGGTR